MTLAFWNAGKLEEAARAVRDWARVDSKGRHRTALRPGSTKTSAPSISLPRRPSGLPSVAPGTLGRGERLGRLRLRMADRQGALRALERALSLGAGGEVRELIDEALALEPSVAG